MPARRSAAGISPASTAISSSPIIRTHDLATHIAHVDAYHRLAREEYGREVKVWTNATVIQAETEAEARGFYDYYVHEKGDWVAARNVIDTMGAEINQRDYPEARRKAMAEMMISGWGGFPLIGTKEQIVDGLARLSQARLRRRAIVMAALHRRHARVSRCDLSAAQAGGSARSSGRVNIMNAGDSGIAPELGRTSRLCQI